MSYRTFKQNAEHLRVGDTLVDQAFEGVFLSQQYVVGKHYLLSGLIELELSGYGRIVVDRDAAFEIVD